MDYPLLLNSAVQGMRPRLRRLTITLASISAGAFGRFSALADQGHLEAARIAMHMLLMGPTLYRSEWGGVAAADRPWVTPGQESFATHAIRSR